MKTYDFWQATFFYGKEKRFSEKIFHYKESVLTYCMERMANDKKITDFDVHKVVYMDIDNLIEK